MVLQSLKEQIIEGIEEPNCTLCGDDCSLSKALQLLKDQAW